MYKICSILNIYYETAQIIRLRNLFRPIRHTVMKLTPSSPPKHIDFHCLFAEWSLYGLCAVQLLPFQLIIAHHFHWAISLGHIFLHSVYLSFTVRTSAVFRPRCRLGSRKSPHWTNHLCKSILESRPAIRRYKKVQIALVKWSEIRSKRKRNRCG